MEKDDDIIKTEDGLVFNPYNPANVQITLNEVQFILQKYGVTPQINNMALYRRAFIHRSYTKRPQFENEMQNIIIMPKPNDCLPLSTKSNERLEYFGDGVLECVTKHLLYVRFPKAEEQFMTEKKIAMVKNEAIGKIALEMGLHKWLILSRNAEEKKTRTNLRKLGCLFEAFIGALFLDFNKVGPGKGYEMAQIFITNIFEAHIDWVALIQNDDNYKNILQVKLQKEFKVTPHYLTIGHDAVEGFQMGVFLCLGQAIHEVNVKNAIDIKTLQHFDAVQEYVKANDGKIFLFLGEGKHKIKRKAEQIACNEALLYLEQCAK